MKKEEIKKSVYIYTILSTEYSVVNRVADSLLVRVE